MRKIVATLIVFVLIFGTVAGGPILVLKAQEQTTITFGVYAEGVDILYGENKAVAAIVSRIGGSVDIGFDISDEAFENIDYVYLSFGKGLDWTRYLHKPLWEVPPGAMLVLGYKVKPGFTEDHAVQKAFAAATLIGNAYGLEFRVMWEELKNNIVHVVFYALMNETEFDLFYQNVFSGILGNQGLMNLMTIDAINDAPYARLLLAIGRDRDDLDKDGDESELIPVAGVGFIAENAIIQTESGEWEISINNIFQRSGPITWSNDSIWSAVSIKIPFPVRMNKTASTPTNSSFPEVTGNYLYLLHAKDITTGWECSWPTELNDIVLRFLPYNYSEMTERFPVLQVSFTAEPYPIGDTQTYLNLILKVKNTGNDKAERVRAIIPLDESTYNAFEGLMEKDILELIGWELKGLRTTHGERYALVAKIGELSPGDTYTAEIKLYYTPQFDPTQVGGLIPFTVGPIVVYQDTFGVRYSVLANGIYYPLSGNGSLIIPHVKVITPSNTSFVEVDNIADIAVNITNYGGLPAHNIRVTVLHAILDEYGNIMRLEEIDHFYIPELKDWWSGEDYTVEVTTTYKVRARPGMHLVGAIISYEGEMRANATSSEIMEFNATILSNLVSMFVLPPYRVRRNIFRYPLPHAEISVNKMITYDNITNRIKVRLEIKNVGDLNTTIIHIIDYWNASQVSFVEGSVKINGSDFSAVWSIINDKIDMLYIAIGNRMNPIRLDVNQTIIVEYELELKVNGTVELISNPAIVIYDFGPYEMEEETKPSEENVTYVGQWLYTAGMEMLQEAASGQFIQTFTEAIVTMVSTPTLPGGAQPSVDRMLRVLIILAGVALAFIVIAAVLVRRRHE